MKYIAPTILILLLFSCVSPPHGEIRSQEDDIREAVFRYQMNIWKDQALKEGVSFYFLDLTGTGGDPSAAFMKRFIGHVPKVEKASQYIITNILVGVMHKQTGERGILFRAGAIKWITKTKVEVSGGYHQNGKSASYNTYTVECQDRKWKVVDDHVHSMAMGPNHAPQPTRWSVLSSSVAVHLLGRAWLSLGRWP